MAFSKLLNLLALSSLAILACSFGASPVNALSIDTHNYVRRDHAVIAKKRSTSTKRCKPRPAASNSTTTDTASAAPKPSPVKIAAKPPVAAPPVAAPPVAAPPQPKPAPAPSSGTGVKGGKVCIAWSSGDDPALAKWATGQASRLYTWSAYLPKDTHGLQGMPMLWGPKNLADFQRLVVQGYSTIALGFNEPDIPSQSNMDPTFAAQYWQEHMNPLKAKGYTLISPATVTGTSWMKAFLAACKGNCHMDAVAVHWYGVDFADLKKTLEAFHNEFNLPVWLTEYACQSFSNQPQCNAGQVWSLMTTFKAYADATPWLETYCWFGAMHDMTNVNILNQLMAQDGSPNPLGQKFLS